MKRYLLFAWNLHYPLGGLRDLEGSFIFFDDAEIEADKLIGKNECDRYQIVDKETMIVIKTNVP